MEVVGGWWAGDAVLPSIQRAASRSSSSVPSAAVGFVPRKKPSRGAFQREQEDISDLGGQLQSDLVELPEIPTIHPQSTVHCEWGLRQAYSSHSENSEWLRWRRQPGSSGGEGRSRDWRGHQWWGRVSASRKWQSEQLGAATPPDARV